jgi:alpha-glucosidase (family GH31 glycosyl hydrolase)
MQAMIDAVASTGRKMVTIVDPHVKRDDKYGLHREARLCPS